MSEEINGKNLVMVDSMVDLRVVERFGMQFSLKRVFKSMSFLQVDKNKIQSIN